MARTMRNTAALLREYADRCEASAVAVENDTNATHVFRTYMENMRNMQMNLRESELLYYLEQLMAAEQAAQGR